MNIDKELKRHFIGRLVENGRRIDGRGFDDFRTVSIETDIISDKAEGSAMVKLGNSEVLCGIKLGVGEPYPDDPSGVLMTGAELVPIASPEFEIGRPGEDAVELARVVDRGIRESKMINMEKLIIEPNEKVWIVYLDLHILNHDGNLLDASTLASVAALKTTWVPKYEDEMIIREEKSMDLPITKLPISFTFAKIGKAIVLDPILDEEYAMDARLTVTTSEKSVHAMQKGENGAFSPDEVTTMVDKALSKYKEVRKLVK